MALEDSIKNISRINVVDLVLDTENYRLGPQANQHDAIVAMVEDQQEKLLELAKDIVKHGLSPFDLITVCPAEEPGKFRVIEGNRRITVLKLLNEPGLAAGSKIAKAIRDIAVANSSKIIKSCDCTIVPSKQDAFIWIQRKHDTGLGGASTISWNSTAIRRAKEALGNRQITLEVIDFVAKNSHLSLADKQRLGKISITNLERILEDPSALSIIGIELVNGELACQYSKDWTFNVLSKIVTDISTKKIKVGDIFDKPKRQRYVASIVSDQRKAPESIPRWSLSRGETISDQVSKGAKAKTHPLPIERKTLIPRLCRLQISHPRLNEIYDELRAKIIVKNAPNSVSVLFRVFIELSADFYLKKANISPANDRLINKLNAIANEFEKNHIMTKKELKPLRLAFNDQNELASTETLNSYVHNLQVIPNPNDLKRAWDSIEPFMIKLWT